MSDLHPSEGSPRQAPLASRVRDLREHYPRFAFADPTYPPTNPDRYLLTHYTSRGKVADLRSKSCDVPVQVYTDSGAIVSKEHEVGTSGLMSCFGIFISGPEANALIHMPPKTCLGYEVRPEFNYLERSMEIVKPSLSLLGPLTDCHMLLMANMVGRRYEEEHQRELEAVAQAFRAAGIGHVKVVGSMPLIQTTLYYSPERPDELLTLGCEVAYDQEGNATTLGKDLHEHWIPLKGNTPVDFGEMPPPDEVERIKKEQYEKFLKSWGK